MCCAGTYFVVATGAAVGFDGPGRGDRAYFVLMAVGPLFDSAKDRREGRRTPPSWRWAAAPFFDRKKAGRERPRAPVWGVCLVFSHTDSLDRQIRAAGTRYCPS